MSASLVGSEMCIRDRLRRIIPAGRLQGSTQSQLCEDASLEQHDNDTQHSVSYTHLTLPTICSV
eukprot:4339202-Alexandrium_andersonii.AAC.1